MAKGYSQTGTEIMDVTNLARLGLGGLPPFGLSLTTCKLDDVNVTVGGARSCLCEWSYELQYA